MRKIVCILILAITAIVLTGCGSVSPSAEPSADPNDGKPREDISVSELPTGTDAPENTAETAYRLIKVVVTGVAQYLTDTEGWGNGIGEKRPHYGNPCVWTLTYDEAGNMLTKIWTDENGESGGYEWTYDPSGNMLKERHFLNGETAEEYEYSYYPDGVRKTEDYENKLGGRSNTEYDEHGNPLKIEAVDLNGHSTRKSYVYVYDDKGEILSQTETLENEELISGKAETVYEWTYDEAGHKVTEYYCYDNGRLVVSGNKTWTYDENGKLTMETSDYGDVRKIVYVRNAEGVVIAREETYYNGETKTVEVTPGDKNAEYEYYPDGTVRVKTKTSSEVTKKWEYDEHGNLVRYTALRSGKPAGEAFTIEFVYEEYLLSETVLP